jgi:hypothetical protein
MAVTVGSVAPGSTLTGSAARASTAAATAPSFPATRSGRRTEGAGDLGVLGVLGVLDEPLDVLSELRAAVADQPAAVRARAPELLASHAVSVWGAQLEPLGIPVTVVTRAFEASRREIWLWVSGDRRWGQLASYLANRVLRQASFPRTNGSVSAPKS